ncbi:hypothetical protein [Paenibacillus sp. NPDC057934]|uniref:hypothetical protein n=1 Tax=Paenibacillus sp. NPDC057934 TaxID=3346282 RepID=UPI0036D9CAC3
MTISHMRGAQVCRGNNIDVEITKIRRDLLNNIPVQLTSAAVSAIVAVLTFLFLHLVIEPWKEKRRRRLEKLTHLYGPLYALIVARGHLSNEMSSSMRHKLNLGSIVGHPFLTKEYTDKLIIEQSAYANTDLIDAWGKYVSYEGSKEGEIVEEFIRAAVKGYSALKKSLGMDYDKEEYRSGLPKIFR